MKFFDWIFAKPSLPPIKQPPVKEEKIKHSEFQIWPYGADKFVIKKLFLVFSGTRPFEEYETVCYDGERNTFHQRNVYDTKKPDIYDTQDEAKAVIDKYLKLKEEKIRELDAARLLAAAHSQKYPPLDYP